MFLFFRGNLLFDRFWPHFGLAFGAVLRDPGTTILLQGCPWHPFKPLLELSWASLLPPDPLRAPSETRYGALGPTSRYARIPSKVWVLAHLGTARLPLYSFGGPLASIRPPLGLSGALLKLLCVSSALPWSALGPILAYF